VIVETAVFVIDDDKQRALPLRPPGERVVDGENQVLAVLDVGRGMVVVDREAERGSMSTAVVPRWCTG
jgi:hypothetical protein